MPDLSKIIDGKKFMWDGKIYDTEDSAKKVAEDYEKESFETQIVTEEDKYLVYNRRVVKEVVVEGPPPV